MTTKISMETTTSRRSKRINGSKNGHALHKEQAGNPIVLRQLRPFFGYYGGKWRDAIKHYPEPEHDTIVEPFAGSAGFSLRYFTRRVILCEVDPVLADVWRYLIRVKPREILSIPDLAPDESVDDLRICQEAKWLVGFWLNRGTASPRKSPSKWMRDGIRPGSFWGDRVRQTIASQVDAIRHWKVHNGSYATCRVSRKATWFIDPPYEGAGRHYRFGSEQIDYAALADWCRSRPGQVIVCENEGASWLPFRELADVKTMRADRRSREVYWLNTFGPSRRSTSKRKAPVVSSERVRWLRRQIPATSIHAFTGDQKGSECGLVRQGARDEWCEPARRPFTRCELCERRVAKKHSTAVNRSESCPTNEA